MMACQTPWLMTDERLGDRLFEAIARVPEGGGVVFRHDREPDRAALGRKVAEAARARGLALAVAGDVTLAGRLRADYVHRPNGDTKLPISMPVHDLEEATRARTIGAALVFVAPVFPTLSHPGEVALGPGEAARLAQRCGVPAIALGGMDEDRFAELPKGAFAGWAAIGAFLD